MTKKKEIKPDYLYSEEESDIFRHFGIGGKNDPATDAKIEEEFRPLVDSIKGET